MYTHYTQFSGQTRQDTGYRNFCKFLLTRLFSHGLKKSKKVHCSCQSDIIIVQRMRNSTRRSVMMYHWEDALRYLLQAVRCPWGLQLPKTFYSIRPPLVTADKTVPSFGCSYCMEFKTESLTPHCAMENRPLTRWMQYLREGYTVCVDCQPPAMNSVSLRCSGDGLDSDG